MEWYVPARERDLTLLSLFFYLCGRVLHIQGGMEKRFFDICNMDYCLRGNVIKSGSGTGAAWARAPPGGSVYAK